MWVSYCQELSPPPIPACLLPACKDTQEKWNEIQAKQWRQPLTSLQVHLERKAAGGRKQRDGGKLRPRRVLWTWITCLLPLCFMEMSSSEGGIPACFAFSSSSKVLQPDRGFAEQQPLVWMLTSIKFTQSGVKHCGISVPVLIQRIYTSIYSPKTNRQEQPDILPPTSLPPPAVSRKKSIQMIAMYYCQGNLL